MSLERRYQVFVSSTYEDLSEERQEVMQALLELDCIPSGMELFPAASEDQWTLIKRVIDDCDYYIVIVGGRYGSIGPDGKSYTQMEYEYAVSQGKPVIGFLHRDPSALTAKRTEQTEEGREKLVAFREQAQKKMCRYWSSPDELGSVVSRSLIKLIKTNPAIGWVRADQVPETSATDEILALRRRIDELEKELVESSSAIPAGTDLLAQGDDEVFVHLKFSAVKPDSYQTLTYNLTHSVTWNSIFARIAPLMIDRAASLSLRRALDAMMQEENTAEARAIVERDGVRAQSISLADDDFQTIMVQLRALSLIQKVEKQKRGVYDNDTYWALTSRGDQAMLRLRALRRPSVGAAEADVMQSTPTYDPASA